jgi:hypothetical protein
VAGLRTYTFTNPQLWSYGNPHGYLFHETAGFSVSLAFSTLNGKGLGVHAIVDRDGTVYATGDLEQRYYHAYEAARFYFGVEHVNAPQEPYDQALTVAQLEASALVAAQIVEFAANQWGSEIPLVKKGCDYTLPGFMDHVDGKLGPIGSPCGWNRNGHTDGLTSTWTWDQYLAAVKDHLTPPPPPPEDDMTPEEHAMLVETRDNTIPLRELAKNLRAKGYPIAEVKAGEPWAHDLAAVLGDLIGPPQP